MTIAFVSVRTSAAVGIMVALLLLLVACGTAATPEPVPTTTAPATPVPATETVEPTLGRGLPTPDGVELPADTLEAIRTAAAVAEVPKEQVTIVEVVPTDFPSTALGCPEPGRAYAEVIVPGYVVIVEAGGERYEFHTDAEGSQVVRCLEPSSVDRGIEEPSMPASEALIEDAKELVSRETGVDAADLTLLESESVEWSDASLGCPQPGMMYAQVITPGFRLVFEGPTGEQFAVHTDASGASMVLCSATDAPRGVAPSPPASDEGAPAPAAEQAALEAASRASGLALNQLEVVDWEAVEWRDSSLGCPQPGANYLMVITPGYRFTIRAGTTVYEVHTDQRGSAVIC